MARLHPEAKDILGRCAVLLNSSTVTEFDAYSVAHDYRKTARNMVPLFTNRLVWKIHGNHLREQWQCFRQKTGLIFCEQLKMLFRPTDSLMAIFIHLEARGVGDMPPIISNASSRVIFSFG